MSFIARPACLASVAIAAVVGNLIAPADAVSEGTISQISVSPTDETEAEGQGRYDPTVSDDGRYVAYSSYASSIVPDDDNGTTDVFLWDKWSGTTTLISRTNAGLPGDGNSDQPRISSNGRFIAFSSSATNFPGGGNPDVGPLIYRYNTVTERIQLVSKSPRGALPTRWVGIGSISATGRYVAYYTQAHNIVPGDHNQRPDVFRYDARRDETIMISQTLAGEQTDKYSHGGFISSNGRYVAYSTRADNMGPADTNSKLDAYVYDVQTDTTTLASHNASGVAVGGWPTDISDDGGVVSMTSGSNKLAPRDTDKIHGAFVYTARTDSVKLVSVPRAEWPDGVQAFSTGVSGNGRYVSYDAMAYLAGESAVYLFDRRTNETTKISVSPAGDAANGPSRSSSLSRNGYFIAFSSSATNLVPGDPYGNSDIFLWSRSVG